MSEQFYIELTRTVAVMITTIFSGIMAYFMARLNIQMRQAAIEAGKAKDLLAETTSAHQETLTVIADHATQNSDKIEGIKLALGGLGDIKDEILENKKIVFENRDQLLKNNKIITDTQKKMEIVAETMMRCPLVKEKRIA